MMMVYFNGGPLDGREHAHPREASEIYVLPPANKPDWVLADSPLPPSSHLPGAVCYRDTGQTRLRFHFGPGAPEYGSVRFRIFEPDRPVK
jgi:hypothetical protein